MKLSPDVSTNKLAFALTLAVSACAVTATAQAAEPIHPGIAFAMQRDLGIMPGQVAQFMKDEDQAKLDERVARTALGAHFAGAWTKIVPGGRARLVVSSTLSPSSVLARLPARLRNQIDVVRADHSLERLERGHSALNAYVQRGAKRGMPGVAGWWVDQASNRIVIETSDSDLTGAIDLAAASGVDVDTVVIRRVAHRSTTLASQILGGSQYIINNSAACSFGFSARRNKSTGGYDEYILIAGHCAENGDVASKNGIRIGTVFGHSFPFNDYAVIRNERPNDWYTTPFVKDNSSDGKLSISGSSPQSIGNSVCRSGFKTGWQCGTLLSRTYTANYGTDAAPIYVYGLGLTNACGGQGDSGGSFVALISGKWHAQGVLSGGNVAVGQDNGCSLPSSVRRTYFQPVNEILTAANVYLVRD